MHRRVLMLLVALLALGLAPPAEASAAAASVTAGDFYAVPGPLKKGNPGAVIRQRAAVVDLGTDAPTAQAWTVMYHSRDVLNRDVAVTGTVMVPAAGWARPGPRPVLAVTVGTQGLGPQCAPSRQLVAGTEGEKNKIIAGLRKGWTVVVTDYLGYTTGSTPSYLVGQDMAHAALDLVRAARQVPGTGVQSTAPLVVWGYSQGGRASAWTSAVQPSYAPELRLTADAAGGIPEDLQALVAFDNGNVGAGFVLAELVGLQAAYGAQFPFTVELNSAGLAAVAQVKQLCTNDVITMFALRNLDSYFLPGHSLAQFRARPDVAAVFAANRLIAQPAPPVPVYQYHGAADEIVPLTEADAVHRSLCTRGVTTRLDLYPGEHATADSVADAVGTAAQWLDDVLNGHQVSSNCVL